MDLAVSQADIAALIQQDTTTARIVGEISRRYLTYLLTSSPENAALKKLRAVGINPNFFSHKIYRDNCGGRDKQDGSAFRHAVELSDFPAANHVYVGNSAKSDIAPAKRVGMQTIGVWSEIPEADASIPHIHQLEGLLL